MATLHFEQRMSEDIFAIGCSSKHASIMTKNIVVRIFKTFLLFKGPRRLMMKDHYDMMHQLHVERHPISIWSYRILRFMVIGFALKLMVQSALFSVDICECPRFVFDLTGCLAHWNGPTRLLYALIYVHTLFSYQILFGHRQPQTFALIKDISTNPKTVSQFFLVDKHQGKRIDHLVHDKSGQLFQTFFLFPVILSKILFCGNSCVFKLIFFRFDNSLWNLHPFHDDRPQKLRDLVRSRSDVNFARCSVPFCGHDQYRFGDLLCCLHLLYHCLQHGHDRLPDTHQIASTLLHHSPASWLVPFGLFQKTSS